MFMPTGKPKSKGEICNRVGIMLGLADRSDEVVVGTKWQASPAEAAEIESLGMVRIVSVAMVPIEHIPPVPVVESGEY